MRILVSGRIQTGSYVNREGRKIYTTDIIVQEQEFADSRNAGSGQEQIPQPQGEYIGDGFMNVPDGLDDEGLPF